MQRRVEELRAQRERNYDPKSADNPRYHHYSAAVSNLLWLTADLSSDSQR